MSALCFLINSPEHRIFKDLNGEVVETLVFDNRGVDKVRIGKGIGAIRISREEANGETGDLFESHWEVVNVADKDFPNNSVRIHNLTPLENPKEQWIDKIVIDRDLGLNLHLYLPSEQFSHLLQINWRDRYLKIEMETKQSINDLKFPLSEEYKRAVKGGSDDATMEFDVREIEVKLPYIVIEELPYYPKGKEIDLQIDRWSRLLKHLFGG